jgi:hypothetical protein
MFVSQNNQRQIDGQRSKMLTHNQQQQQMNQQANLQQQK